MNKYRVLIVDDKEHHLKIAKEAIAFKYEQWSIEKNIAHIKVNENGDNQYSIDEKSIENIAKLSANPFDLLLLDFAYYIEGGYQNIRNKLEEEYRDKSYTVSDSEKYIFNPKTLVEKGKIQLKENSDKRLYKWFEKNFEGHKGPVYGYTYNEKETEHLIFNLNHSKDKLLETFSKSKHIEMKGTRQDIFNNMDFENINEKNKEIYPFILAKYLEQLIKIEITKREVESAKYIKIKRTSKTIGALVLFGVIMGACSNFFGSLIVGFFKENEFLIALIFICFTIIIIIGVGTLVVHFLEKLLPKLINEKAKIEE